jgi:hypothetical protein
MDWDGTDLPLTMDLTFFKDSLSSHTRGSLKGYNRWPYAKVSESLSAKGGTLRSLAGRFRRNGPEDFRPSHELMRIAREFPGVACEKMMVL